jgi:hypothetical protein
MPAAAIAVRCFTYFSCDWNFGRRRSPTRVGWASWMDA